MLSNCLYTLSDRPFFNDVLIETERDLTASATLNEVEESAAAKARVDKEVKAR
jgi:hypothetical protein